ncbi:MAG: MFS transporter [Halieaceae bacterium]|jgi:MFS family permease|nr:MFS transporter [Halieaceae bacterium]
MAKKSPMNALERRSVLALSALYCFRMLGLFMVLPLLTLYGGELEGSTPFLLGLAIGIYGLTQSFLQVPLGMLSDRIGRIPVLVGGLAMFAGGSFLAATATTIEGVIFGRLLQGAGAISSTIMALVADLTRDQQRTKAMAIVGISIGVSFAIAILLGPLLASAGGLALVFNMTGAMAVIGILVVIFAIPRVERVGTHGEVGTVPGLLWRTLTDFSLFRLNAGVFTLHFILMAAFVALPLVLEQELGVAREAHWKIYLPVVVLSVIGMIPLIILGDRSGKLRLALGLGVSGLAISQLLASGALGFAVFCLGLWLYFTTFNYLESALPSLVSKTVYAGGKGTALGIYATFQFLGAFVGGAAGGLAMEIGGVGAVLSTCTAVALLWLPLALSTQPPRELANRMLRLPDDPGQAEQLLKRLPGMEGVADMLLIPEDATVYLKVDENRFDASILDLEPEGGEDPGEGAGVVAGSQV